MGNDYQDKKSEEGSLGDLIIALQGWVRYFLSKWFIILLFGIVGGLCGLAYSFWKEPVYTAKTSFVLETGGSRNVLGAYAGIASSFGIDLGGSGGGLFMGENILELYRSRKMITSALLTSAEIEGKKQLLIDRYLEFNKIKESWDLDEQPELKKIRFDSLNKYASPSLQILHDSIIGKISTYINMNNLVVEKVDERLDIIEVSVVVPDELFAKKFNEALVQNVTQFYVDTKTKRAEENVYILQKKADSVRAMMSGSIQTMSAIADATPNQNPTRLALRNAPIQKSQANAAINQVVLEELLKNLEISKISMAKEAPLIQLVDTPILPLEEEKVGKLFSLVVGGLLGGIAILSFLIIKRIYRMSLAQHQA